MEYFEKVEKLVQKAGVSYEEAKAALDASNGDLLDAMIMLERAGKTEEEQLFDPLRGSDAVRFGRGTDRTGTGSGRRERRREDQGSARQDLARPLPELPRDLPER